MFSGEQQHRLGIVLRPVVQDTHTDERVRKALALFDLMEKFVERHRNPVAGRPLAYDPGGDLPLLPVRIGDGGIGEN